MKLSFCVMLEEWGLIEKVKGFIEREKHYMCFFIIKSLRLCFYCLNLVLLVPCDPL